MLRIFRSLGALVLLLSMSLNAASAQHKVRVNQFSGNHQPAVVMIDSSLDPPVLKVKQGTTVEWINNGDGRAVVATDHSFSSGILKPGANFQHTFDRRGKFEYLCRSREAKSGGDIWGKIVVTK
jgi:plastocyanin